MADQTLGRKLRGDNSKYIQFDNVNNMEDYSRIIAVSYPFLGLWPYKTADMGALGANLLKEENLYA